MIRQPGYGIPQMRALDDKQRHRHCNRTRILLGFILSIHLELGSTQKRHGTICAIAALESIFDKYDYHVLDKALRMLVRTWEGEMNSLSGNTLNAVARLIAAFGDALNEETFKGQLGLIPIKTIIRTASGSLGYAEAMLVFYNKKCRYLFFLAFIMS